jgi:hypothetical protein
MVLTHSVLNNSFSIRTIILHPPPHDSLLLHVKHVKVSEISFQQRKIPPVNSFCATTAKGIRPIENINLQGCRNKNTALA